MAIMDKELQFALGQADHRAAATYLSTNVVDLGHARGRKIIAPEQPILQIRVGAAYVGGTSITWELVSADNEALSTNPQVIASTGAILTANLTINTIVAEIALPRNIPRRYLGVKGTVVGVMSAGTHDINIGVGEQLNPF